MKGVGWGREEEEERNALEELNCLCDCLSSLAVSNSQIAESSPLLDYIKPPNCDPF